MAKPSLQNVGIEEVDRAIRDWFDKTMNVRVEGPKGMQKVPIVFSQGERWVVGRSKQGLRDENGVIILPVIAVRRTGIDPTTQMTALGTQTRSIQIARQVNPKSNALRNLGYKGSVYDIYTIPFPSALMATYQLVIQTQYVTQMNSVLQKMWKSMDFGLQFVAPLQNDGRQPLSKDQFYNETGPMDKPYVVGFLDQAANDAGNIEEFTDTERIVKYTTEFKVPFVMQVDAEGQPSQIKVERTAFKVTLDDEQVHFVDDPADLDDIFGPLH